MTKPTVHLVYPHGQKASAPDAIGRNLAARLATVWPVRCYDWDQSVKIEPAEGDILLGHMHHYPNTAFRLSIDDPRWSRVVIMQPYCHGEVFSDSFVEWYIDRTYRFLTICGDYWFETMESSCFAYWKPKCVHLDLAVDPQDFPPLERSFAAPGQRRFVYIGHTYPYKNTGYLSELASHLPPGTIDHVGGGSIEGLTGRGYLDFSTPEGRAAIAEYDFMLTVGSADANPTTILEAMSWGLVPIVSKESGYREQAGLANISIHNLDDALQTINRFQQLPSAELEMMREANWARIHSYYNWDRFAEVVQQVLSSDEPAIPLHAPWWQRLRLRWYSWISPYSPYYPRTLASRIKRKLFG